jgi:excisionase family DNA binding protein
MRQKRPVKSNNLTISQAATLRGVSRQAIYSAIERGVLPALWDAGRWKIAEKDLLAWNANPAKRGPKPGKKYSEEHRAKLSAVRKADWAKRKQGEK